MFIKSLKLISRINCYLILLLLSTDLCCFSSEVFMASVFGDDSRSIIFLSLLHSSFGKRAFASCITVLDSTLRMVGELKSCERTSLFSGTSCRTCVITDITVAFPDCKMQLLYFYIYSVYIWCEIIASLDMRNLRHLVHAEYIVNGENIIISI